MTHSNSIPQIWDDPRNVELLERLWLEGRSAAEIAGMILGAILGDHGEVRNLGDVRWIATEDGSVGKGTGRHIACFILRAARGRGE